MRAVRWLGPALIVLGITALAVGFLRNEATLSLVVIIPVITATGAWAGLGIFALLVGVVAVFLTWPASMAGSPAPAGSPPPDGGPPPAAAPVAVPSRRWGGVVFLGPIPVVFGSDARVTRWMLVAGLVLVVALLVLTVIALWGI